MQAEHKGAYRELCSETKQPISSHHRQALSGEIVLVSSGASGVTTVLFLGRFVQKSHSSSLGSGVAVTHKPWPVWGLLVPGSLGLFGWFLFHHFVLGFFFFFNY